MVREEAFYFLIEQLLEEHMIPMAASRELSETAKNMKQYLDTHLEETVSLETLSEISSMSRYQLLRLFTREVGVSPYRYLQSDCTGEGSAGTGGSHRKSGTGLRLF